MKHSRVTTNGNPGAPDPDRLAEVRSLEYDQLVAKIKPTHREWHALRAAVRRWGQKDPCPIDVLAKRLGPDYRAGLDSLAVLIALTGGH